MKSYSIQQKPCQVIAEGCSYQLQRYKNNLKKQMILQENRKIDRNRLHPAQNNWHKSHSRFYSSLFTKSPGTPVFIGITGGEEWSFTLHHSSPLFTTLHHFLPSFTGNSVLTFSYLSQESKILPLPWQYFAPTRHKTKRRDRKKSPTGRLFFPNKRILAFSAGTDQKP